MNTRRRLLNAVKGNCVAAAPPGTSTPKKHGDAKGDMETCADTAVSEPTRRRGRLYYARFPPSGR
ncbi:hypothetical protein EYF80_039059 [Liparis tanakae]|uniref:Uncharacterized protein n=1 Tax=Liparis tanakae TaxID=230148 RepID=A0A4Z2GAZ6_9TELE|nr:hypothetical protein EYF80_039059 [Liparis tanakae]